MILPVVSSGRHVIIKIPASLFGGGPAMTITRGAKYAIANTPPDLITVTFMMNGPKEVLLLGLGVTGSGKAHAQASHFGIEIDNHLQHLGVKPGDKVDVTVINGSLQGAAFTAKKI